MKTNIFITGATGVIGQALVPLYLNDRRTEVHLLIRGDGDEHVAARLEALLAEWRESQDTSGWTGRLHAHRGDITLPRLGLGTDYDGLTRRTTHVVHCAANVKMNLPLAEARKVSVEATGRVLDFVQDCRNQAPFCKFDYVSTVGVAGRMQGTIPEEPLSSQPGFHNTYEQAKAEAEQRVIEKMKAGWPISIHRPSMIVGESQTGKTNRFQVFYHLIEFLAGRKTSGVVPRLGEYRLDIVPVDYVAQSIRLSGMDDEAVGKIFHLCSGPSQAVMLSEISQRARDCLRRKHGRLPRLRPLSPGLFNRYLSAVAMLSAGRTRRRYRSLQRFQDYLKTSQVFENRRTRRFLEARGVLLPSPADYLDRVMGYYMDRHNGNQRREENGPQRVTENDTPITLKSSLVPEARA